MIENPKTYTDTRCESPGGREEMVIPAAEAPLIIAQRGRRGQSHVCAHVCRGYRYPAAVPYCSEE